MNGFSWYQQRLDIRDEGWKLHVSGNAANAAALYGLVLPVLRLNNIAHKVLLSYVEIDRQQGNQQGKILAVYPDNIAQAFQAVQLVDAALVGWSRRDSPRIPIERAVGNTVVYTRYGAYSNLLYNPGTQAYVPDSRGQLKPQWIQDPWPHYPNAGAVAQLPAWPVHDQGGHAGRGGRRGRRGGGGGQAF